jgi:hypothetical protein
MLCPLSVALGEFLEVWGCGVPWVKGELRMSEVSEGEVQRVHDDSFAALCISTRATRARRHECVVDASLLEYVQQWAL